MSKMYQSYFPDDQMINPDGFKYCDRVTDLYCGMDGIPSELILCDAQAAAIQNYMDRDFLIRKGRPFRIVISQKLLDGTLGNCDIVKQIMSFLPDEDFVQTFVRYLMVSKNITNDLIPNCLKVLYERRILVCKTKFQLEFLCDYFTIGQNINVEIVIDDLEASDWRPKYLSFVERFPIVHLRKVSMKKKTLIEMLNRHTSKIKHLKFTSCKPLEGEMNCTSRYLPLTHLKTATFKDQNTNPLYEISDFTTMRIHELVFNSQNTSQDYLLINDLRIEWKKLAMLHPNVSNIVKFHLFQPKRLCMYTFPKHLIHTKTLNLETVSNNVCEVHNELVKKIVMRGFDKGNCKGDISLREFMNQVISSYKKCEELVLSETFIYALSEEDIKEEELLTNIKKITIKHSKNTQVSIYGALKYGLQFIFPKAIIVLKEIQDERYLESHKKFALHPSSVRFLKQDCFEDELYRKIEKLENDFKVMDNSFLKEQIRDMKMIFCKCIASGKFSKLSLIQDTLNILEGLKRNKELMLENINQAIENYSGLFGADDLFLLTSDIFDKCLETLEGEVVDQDEFSKYYGELEVLFHKMIQVVEENGYPTKVLFNDQWFSDQIVELYNFGLPEQELYFYEDE